MNRILMTLSTAFLSTVGNLDYGRTVKLVSKKQFHTRIFIACRSASEISFRRTGLVLSTPTEFSPSTFGSSHGGIVVVIHRMQVDIEPSPK